MAGAWRAPVGVRCRSSLCPAEPGERVLFAGTEARVCAGLVWRGALVPWHSCQGGGSDLGNPQRHLARLLEHATLPLPGHPSFADLLVD